jgi:murein DD-endopeptidase MepM/ murein hydrolase activator NlpD
MIYPQAIGADVAKTVRIRSTLASREHRPFSRSLLPMGTLALVVVCLLLLVACDQGSDAPTITATATVSPTTTAPTSPATPSTAMPPATFTVGATNTPSPTRVPSATATSPVLAPATATSMPPRAPTAASSLTPLATAPAPAQPTATQASGSGAGHRYVFPVSPASVTNYGPYHHDYPATDIFCPVGSLFVAPTDGVVDFVSIKDSWDPNIDDPATRGGLSVAIIGADGVRYYGSHLSAIEPGIMPGVQVAAGQVLGKTGKSGDARFTDSHLHFGISPPTTPADWETRRGIISPYKYLRAWEAGTQLQPVLP